MSVSVYPITLIFTQLGAHIRNVHIYKMVQKRYLENMKAKYLSDIP